LGLLQQAPQTFLKGSQQQGIPLSESEIEAKIAQRIEAKASKNFAQADAVRDELAAMGIILKDSREGTSWVFEVP
ncbi:MAG: cysteine--tRNA ligase, partial [Halomonas sp.]|nr:cysteine--tRNA ligase [Halomonas sp.]